MEKYNLTQTGQEVQEILDSATPQSGLTAETQRAQQAEHELHLSITDEENRAKAAERQNADDIDAIESKIPSSASPENKLATIGDVNDEAETRAGADAALRDLIDAISALIPEAASALNQLADKQFVSEEIIEQIVATIPNFAGQFTTLAQLQDVESPKAGDIGIVRTKDTDGHDVFTFYQYKDGQWNEFYSLSYHPQRKPASTGLVGEAPYNGMGRIELPMNWVEGWPNDTWLYYPYHDIVYLMYYWNGQMYAVYNAGTQEGLGLDDNLVVKPLEYNIADIQDFVGERYLPFTESSGVWTITKPDDSTITSTELNNTNIYKVNDPTHLGINVLTQAMINRPNTIYVIQHDYDLNGEIITIPEGCVLYFEGGHVSNGSIILSDGCTVDGLIGTNIWLLLDAENITIKNCAIHNTEEKFCVSRYYNNTRGLKNIIIENNNFITENSTYTTVQIHTYPDTQEPNANIIIRNNKIRTSRIGIEICDDTTRFADRDYVSTDNVIIDSNEIQLFKPIGDQGTNYLYGMGISVAGCINQAIVSNNNISKCRIGIELVRTTNAFINNNDVYDLISSKTILYFTRHPSNIFISNNKFRNGLCFLNADDCYIKNNYCQDVNFATYDSPYELALHGIVSIEDNHIIYTYNKGSITIQGVRYNPFLLLVNLPERYLFLNNVIKSTSGEIIDHFYMNKPGMLTIKGNMNYGSMNHYNIINDGEGHVVNEENSFNWKLIAHNPARVGDRNAMASVVSMSKDGDTFFLTTLLKHYTFYDGNWYSPDGINSYDDRHYGTTANRPTGLNNPRDRGFMYYDSDLGKPIFFLSSERWVDSDGYTACKSVGTTAERPTDVLLSYADEGFRYFDTDLGKPIYLKVTNTGTEESPILVKSWVDALGGPV